MSIAGSKGTSSVLWYGREGGYDIIVLEYLGNSLGDLIDEQKFDSRKAFEPDNFMVKADSVTPTVFLIDFDLARQFRDPATHLHIPYTTKHSIVGTLLFTSINGQQGYAQSRRDDLESLVYTIIYLARGDLLHEAVLQEKMSLTAEELCEGLPAPFREFIVHVRSLGFNKKPDYEHLHSILSQCSDTEIDQPDKALPFSAPPLSV